MRDYVTIFKQEYPTLTGFSNDVIFHQERLSPGRKKLEISALQATLSQIFKQTRP